MNYIWKYKTPEGFDDLVMCEGFKLVDAATRQT